MAPNPAGPGSATGAGGINLTRWPFCKDSGVHVELLNIFFTILNHSD